MIVNVTASEIIEACPYISNNIIQKLEDFEEALEESEAEWNTYYKLLISGDLSNFSNAIKTLRSDDYLEEINSRVCKNIGFLESIEQKIDHLRTSQNDLQRIVAENKKELKRIESKMTIISKKMEQLLETRDKIQICKLLTNTSFAYNKGGSVQGYVIGPASHSMHCFELNPTKLSQSDITNHLYDVLKKASLESGTK